MKRQTVDSHLMSCRSQRIHLRPTFWRSQNERFETLPEDMQVSKLKIHEHLRSIEAWKEEMEWLTKSHEYRELDCIGGEPVEVEWKISQLLREIQKTVKENGIHLNSWKMVIIFLSMNNDIDRRKVGNRETCVSNSLEVATYAKIFHKVHWSFVGPGTVEKW